MDQTTLFQTTQESRQRRPSPDPLSLPGFSEAKAHLESEGRPSAWITETVASVTAKSTLAPTHPVATSLYVTGDENGEMVVAEMVPQIPGQLNLDGTQQEPPKILKLVKHG